MVARTTILSASAYFASIAVVALLDEDLYSSFESIEKEARSLGLEYANWKDRDGVFKFMKGDFLNRTLEKLKKDFRSRKRKQTVNYDYTDFDY